MAHDFRGGFKVVIRKRIYESFPIDNALMRCFHFERKRRRELTRKRRKKNCKSFFIVATLFLLLLLRSLLLQIGIVKQLTILVDDSLLCIALSASK
jgi:hypothetical protein